jgi:hypothetical protein
VGDFGGSGRRNIFQTNQYVDRCARRAMQGRVQRGGVHIPATAARAESLPL